MATHIQAFECVTGSGQSACAGSGEHVLWTVRDLDGEVLRVWDQRFQANGWTWIEDNIFRDGQPLATLLSDGNGNDDPRHLHLDHLGTPRQITDATGTQVAFHSYYPFGEEATDPNQDPVRLKFTGHERDENGGGEGKLDYMHARYESPMIGRFLSVDPILSTDGGALRGWNRYAYALDNPLLFVDPTGLVTRCVNGEDGTIVCTEDEPLDVVGEDPGKDASFDPNTGLAGLKELTLGRLKMSTVAARLPVARLSLGDRILSAIPINGGVAFGRCIRENRFRFPEIALGSAVPKRLLPPFRVVNPRQPNTSLPSVAAFFLRRALPNSLKARSVAAALRTGGRALSRVATPVTVFEGFFDIGVISRCGFNSL